MKAIDLESHLVGRSTPEAYCKNKLVAQASKLCCIGKESEEDRTSGSLNSEHTGTSAVDQEQSPVDDSNPCSTSPICSAPLCRQFWKAGNYDDGLSSKHSIQKGTSYLHVHPKFLHSNATSHKWPFGAIAELVDNAVDEKQNGATFVIVDKTLNPRDGSSALLIQDDGGGMDPEAMRRCLSFGFSDKKSNSAIGQYGNGFKTSSMRLGADVVVFSRCMKNRKSTQSIGLLSYTFLTQTGHDQIVVPMVDYEFNAQSDIWNTLNNSQQYMNNLSLLLRWSPYSTETELLKQFDDVGHHGTKIIIYNLWYTNERKLEFDFESDPEDIHIPGEANKSEKISSRTAATEQHLANRLRFSLRAYLSILYMRVPENFYILLRGRIVEFHNIAKDLKFPEFIVYKPQSVGYKEAMVVTTIGFLKEAPHVNIHGFNVYHKNRLILPFWHVVSFSSSRCRGVVGVLEANFVEPTHNKQDFEKTPVFQKLEHRLKEMTCEYWDYHCGLIGYQPIKRARTMTSQTASDNGKCHWSYQPVLLSRGSCATLNAESSASPGAIQQPTAVPSNFSARKPSHGNFQRGAGVPLNGKENSDIVEPERLKRKIGTGDGAMLCNQAILPVAVATNEFENQEAARLIQENKRLQAQCLEHEKREEELNLKVARLRMELGEAQSEYSRLLAELKLLEIMKK
ncbi:hypothetical protein ACH5RR_008794 [Cinchona calisaya]|uniref:Morc S5 domain-containing protein n=1 Tax=Cinchona calisaya TaxID=153742 RepID=A0ABD3AG69_9GENT